MSKEKPGEGEEFTVDAAIYSLNTMRTVTTPGVWQSGQDMRSTFANNNGKLTRIAAFANMTDAAYVDACHRHVPDLIAEIQRLRKLVGENA